MGPLFLIICPLVASQPLLSAPAAGEKPFSGCHAVNLNEERPATRHAITTFFKELKTQVAEDHKAQVANMMAYPLNVMYGWTERIAKSDHGRSSWNSMTEYLPLLSSDFFSTHNPTV
jgi:hypothetical protein